MQHCIIQHSEEKGYQLSDDMMLSYIIYNFYFLLCKAVLRLRFLKYLSFSCRHRKEEYRPNKLISNIPNSSPHSASQASECLLDSESCHCLCHSMCPLYTSRTLAMWHFLTESESTESSWGWTHKHLFWFLLQNTAKHVVIYHFPHSLSINIWFWGIKKCFTLPSWLLPATDTHFQVWTLVFLMFVDREYAMTTVSLANRLWESSFIKHLDFTDVV